MLGCEAVLHIAIANIFVLFKMMAQRQLFLEPNELLRNFEALETEILVSGQDTSALLNE